MKGVLVFVALLLAAAWWPHSTATVLATVVEHVGTGLHGTVPSVIQHATASGGKGVLALPVSAGQR